MMERSDSTLSNFTDLCTSLGRAIASDYGTSLEWVDLHAKNPDMKQYQQYQIRVDTTNVHYSDNTNISPYPGFTINDETVNDGDTAITSDFKKSHDTTTSFTWSMTEAIELGMSVEFQVGVPLVASGKTTLSAKMSVSSTQQQTKSEEEAWNINKEVTTSPHSVGTVTWTIVEKQYEATFYADVNIFDWVAFWFYDKIDLSNKGGSDKHWLWFLRVPYIWSLFHQYNISVSSQYSSSGGPIVYHAVGKCRGHEGVDSHFKYSEKPIPSSSLKKIPFVVAAEKY